MPATVTDTVARVEGVEGPVSSVEGSSQRMSASDPWKDDIAVPLAGGHGNDPDTGSQPVVMRCSRQSYKGGSDRRDTVSAVSVEQTTEGGEDALRSHVVWGKGQHLVRVRSAVASPGHG